MRFLNLGLVAAGALCFSTAPGWASLVPIGAISNTGQGHGAVLTSVTFQNSGTESGCVGTNTSGTQASGNTNVFLGSAECPGGITGGNETKGNGPSGLYTAAQLGIQSGNTAGLNLANVVLLFNGVQEQANTGVTLSKVALDLWSPAGQLLASYTGPSESYNALPGTGNAGFGYQLDAGQAKLANSVLAANPDLLVGAAGTVTGSNGGPETLSFTTVNTVQGNSGGGGVSQSPVPEPISMSLMGGGLVALALLRRRHVRVR